MSSPANTSISFQPTDAAEKDKRQTNLTSVGGKNPLLCKQKHQNQGCKRQCSRCNAAVQLPQAYRARNLFLQKEKNQRMPLSRAERAIVCRA